MIAKIPRILAALSLAIALLVCASAAQVSLRQYATAPHQLAGNPDIKVWVNTPSGVYHCPGTRWYGATKRGEYMTQKQAQEKGNRPAYGRVCQ